MLEQRYLRVDSLCIVSDDVTDQATQIPQMASIYGHALLTIIAAAGEYADHGLTGFRVPRAEHHVVDIGECHIVQACAPCTPASRKKIWDTEWASRAWTFQEMLLSPRSLVFLDWLVIWYCKETKWWEEFDFEHPQMNFHWKDEADNANLTVKYYANLVTQYTSRQLTF